MALFGQAGAFPDHQPGQWGRHAGRGAVHRGQHGLGHQLGLQNPDNLTLTVGLAYLQNAFSVDPRTLAAGAMIALLPILLLFLLLQRFFFRGVGEGAIKG